MANLSQDNCTIITEHPLDNSLDHLRDSLRKAEQSFKPGSIDDAGNISDQGPLKAVVRLLTTLQSHDVAIIISSKTGNGDLASELITIFRRVRNGEFNYEHYHGSSQLIITKAPDVEIWIAVFDLFAVKPLSKYPCLTPPYTSRILL